MDKKFKIGLIGGSGFIGTTLAPDLWRDGHFVKIIDVQPSPQYPDAFAHGDVRDAATLAHACAGCDILINLAAAHRDDIKPLSLYHDVNVGGAQNVCQTARDHNIRTIIFTSSAAVYGHQDKIPDENSPFSPINEYGRTKAAAEDVYRAWQAESPSDRTLVIIRPTVVFGPGNRGNVHTLIDQIARGKFLMIGPGTNRKSMAYVSNLCGFITQTLKSAAGVHVYNYVDAPDLTMNELVLAVKSALGQKNPHIGLRLPKIIGLTAGAVFDTLSSITGRNFPISKVRVEKFCAESVFSAEKMRREGFKPAVTIPVALKQTIARDFATKD